MKIEILVVDNINEKCTGMTCFEATENTWDTLKEHKTVRGIVTIDDTMVKFSFSPYFRDGDIFTDNAQHKILIKYLIPIYFATLVKTGDTTYLKDYAKLKTEQ